MKISRRYNGRHVVIYATGFLWKPLLLVGLDNILQIRNVKPKPSLEFLLVLTAMAHSRSGIMINSEVSWYSRRYVCTVSMEINSRKWLWTIPRLHWIRAHYGMVYVYCFPVIVLNLRSMWINNFDSLYCPIEPTCLSRKVHTSISQIKHATFMKIVYPSICDNSILLMYLSFHSEDMLHSRHVFWYQKIYNRMSSRSTQSSILRESSIRE